jgi:CBS domain containing-hemolysin-like protein
MPVYAENLDDPRGMIHIRDLLAWITKQAGETKRKSAAKARKRRSHKLNVAQCARPVGKSRTEQDASGVWYHPQGPVRAGLHACQSDLMQRMQAHRIQMALVIDEYGGTDGLVSLEDIVEMVVGDIEPTSTTMKKKR